MKAFLVQFEVSQGSDLLAYVSGRWLFGREGREVGQRFYLSVALRGQIEVFSNGSGGSYFETDRSAILDTGAKNLWVKFPSKTKS